MAILDAIKKILGFVPPTTRELNSRATHAPSIVKAVVKWVNPLVGIEITDEYKKAKRLIDEHVPLLFVTGKAGTGKSTFIEYLRHSLSRRLAVLAPTGVAALNVRGVTVHSFFGFPPTLFLRFRGLQPGIRRNSFYGKHLYEVVREAEIPPQLSATQGFRVILAN